MSSINNSLLNSQQDVANKNTTQYERLNQQYTSCGFTYKSNQILHKISSKRRKHYPYLLVLYVSKLFHLNQFEIIFFSHILSSQEPCYTHQPDIFNPEQHLLTQQSLEIINEIYQQSAQNYSKSQNNNALGDDILEVKKQQFRDFEEEAEDQEENLEENQIVQYNVEDLKKIFLYLLVIGYAVKYYLNQQMKIKPYQEYLKKILPSFFSNVFNKWAKQYGNSALNTTPRRINAYYMNLGFLQGEQDVNEQKAQDCQFRNYNEIVEQLLKHTNDGQDHTDLGLNINNEQNNNNKQENGQHQTNGNHHGHHHNHQQDQFQQ